MCALCYTQARCKRSLSQPELCDGGKAPRRRYKVNRGPLTSSLRLSAPGLASCCRDLVFCGARQLRGRLVLAALDPACSGRSVCAIAPAVVAALVLPWARQMGPARVVLPGAWWLWLALLALLRLWCRAPETRPCVAGGTRCWTQSSWNAERPSATDGLIEASGAGWYLLGCLRAAEDRVYRGRLISRRVVR